MLGILEGLITELLDVTTHERKSENALILWDYRLKRPVLYYGDMYMSNDNWTWKMSKQWELDKIGQLNEKNLDFKIVVTQLINMKV